MLTIFDHLLALLLVVIWPAYAAWGHPRWLRQLATGKPGVRLGGYREGLAISWGHTLVLLGLWVGLARSWPALGLGWEGFDLRFALGLGLALAALIFLERQRWMLRQSPDAQSQVIEALGNAEPILPHTKAELRWFHAISVTAGICEEVLYRGFLTWYLASWLPWWAALVGSTVVFGYAHIYLGPKAAFKAGIAGALNAGLYFLTGSLWVPILLHAGIDLNAGLTGFEALRKDREVVPAADDPTPA